MRVLRITPLWDWRALDPPPMLRHPEESMGGHAAQALRTTLATAVAGVEQLVLAPRTPGAPRDAVVALGARVRGVGPAGVPGVHRRNTAWLAGVVVALPGERRAGWDLVHVHASGIVEPLWAALAARSVLRVPLVLTLHHSAQATYVAHSRRDAAVQVVTRAAERAAVRRAARTLTLTSRLARRLDGDGATEAVPDGVDVPGFAREAHERAGAALRARLGIPEDAPLALYAGRISREKGWPDAVALADGIEGLHVLLAGDGPEMDELRACRSERVHVAGAVEHDEVAAAMATASVLVLPSQFEELGSVLVEAMAAGLPSVAYDVGGVAEAVVPGTTGTLVPAGDLPALIAAVAETLADDTLRTQARTEGPRIATERFDQAAIGRRLAALYAELA